MQENISLMVKPDSKYFIEGSDIFLQLDLNNMEIPIDRFVLIGDVMIDDTKSKGWNHCLCFVRW